MRLTGLAGEWEVHGLDPQEGALRAGARPGDPGFGEVPEVAWGVISDGAAPRPVPSARGDWPAFYAGVAGALRDGGPPPVDPRDAVRVLDVIDRIRAYPSG